MARLGSWDLDAVELGWFGVDALAAGWADRDYLPDPTIQPPPVTALGGMFTGAGAQGGWPQPLSDKPRRFKTAAELAREEEEAKKRADAPIETPVVIAVPPELPPAPHPETQRRLATMVDRPLPAPPPKPSPLSRSERTVIRLTARRDFVDAMQALPPRTVSPAALRRRAFVSRMADLRERRMEGR
jgi:hypothetical protein